MNKKRGLDHLLQLGQINTINYREKKIAAMKADFQTLMTKYQTNGPLDFDPIVRPLDFEECSEKMRVIVQKIKDALDGGEKEVVNAHISLDYYSSLNDDKFSTNRSGGAIVDNAMDILVSTFIHGLERSDFNTCAYDDCDNIFVRFSIKERNFCCVRCTTLAAHKAK